MKLPPASRLRHRLSGVKASPVAVRVASDKDVALEQVAGTGPGGRITKDDVLAMRADGGAGQRRAGAATLPDELADVASLAVRRVAGRPQHRPGDVADGRPLSTLTRYDVLERCRQA